MGDKHNLVWKTTPTVDKILKPKAQCQNNDINALVNLLNKDTVINTPTKSQFCTLSAATPSAWTAELESQDIETLPEALLPETNKKNPTMTPVQFLKERARAAGTSYNPNAVKKLKVEAPVVDFSNDVDFVNKASVLKKKQKRFIVHEVDFSTKNIIRLILYNEAEQKKAIVHLIDDWIDTVVSVGDFVNIAGDFTYSSKIPLVIGNDCKLLVIVNPDTLISVTKIAETYSCFRKAVLSERLKSTVKTAPMIYGTMGHSLFEQGLRERDFSSKFFHGAIRRVVGKHIEDLYEIKQDEQKAADILHKNVPLIQNWVSKYIDIPLKEEKKPAKKTFTKKVENIPEVQEILEIEERIWSPCYGIKGNIDVSAKVGSSKKITPLEVKTGKSTSNTSHEVQTIMYGLLMGESYDEDILVGLLCYINSDSEANVKKVDIQSDHIRNILIRRNSLSSFLKVQNELPPLRDNTKYCSQCDVLNQCKLFLQIDEGAACSNSKNDSVFHINETEILTVHQKEFLTDWNKIISEEESDVDVEKRDIWIKSSKERERQGKCFSNMKIESCHTNPIEGINKYTLKFIKHPNSPVNLLNSMISVGDPVVVSKENGGKIAVTVGFVVDIGKKSVIINADKKINAEAIDNEPVYGVSKDECLQLFRIDKDEMSTGMGMLRNNLVSLFTNPQLRRLKELVVDLDIPRFDMTKEAQCRDDFVKDSLLNIDQKNALISVVCSLDYSLILGMPGTGKTTTVSKIINYLINNCEQTVLITGYTHSSVDNILLKLLEGGVDFLRLGNIEKIDKRIQPFCSSNLTKDLSVDDVALLYRSKKVVATTCLGIKHPIFSRKRFDYCIVDEASQVILPVCLGPLKFADKFVLVGDHYQLPPLVKSTYAQNQKGGNLSLFKLLSEAHPEAIVNLEYQYRMNSAILEVSNTLTYQQRLRCGDSKIANQRLTFPLQGDIHIKNDGCDFKRNECWIEKVIQPKNSVVFANTDCLPAYETKGNELGGVTNIIEASLVSQIIQTLVSCGLTEEMIGVISPYRSQLKIITAKVSEYKSIEISTVDKYQGKDKEVIIISLVRSNPEGHVGDLIKDWKRINVAFTRAKKKLIVIGSKSTLSNVALFNDFFRLVEDRGLNFNLPVNAHFHHAKLQTQ